MSGAVVTRKLIDVKAPVIRLLSKKAAVKGMSLKRYMEYVLETDALDSRESKTVEGVHSEAILGLIGVAKMPEGIELDERAKYILSK